MKKLAILALSLLGVFVASCYDDSALKESIASLDKRVKDLETWQSVATNNISTLDVLVQGLGSKVFISSVSENSDGYVIEFTDGKKVTIKDGAPGSTPQIGVKKDTDGVYYWTLNGDWLLGASGEKLRVTGEDGSPGDPGAPGTPGSPGAPGVTPQLKIVDGYWYVSTDKGATWTKLDKATGEPGDSMFKDVTWDDGFVYFILADGTELKVSRGAYDDVYYETEGQIVCLLSKASVSASKLKEMGFTEEIVDAVEAMKKKDDETFIQYVERAAQNELARELIEDKVRLAVDISSLKSIDGAMVKTLNENLEALHYLESLEIVE